MEKLRTQVTQLLVTAWSSIAAVYLVLFTVIQLAPQWSKEIGFVGQALTIIPAILLFLYREKGWRLLNPSLDFSGIWNFVETQSVIDEKTGELVFDFDAWGSVEIVQTTQSIRLMKGSTFREVNGAPVKISNWWSTACELHEEHGEIVAVLDHTARDPKARFTRLGIEVMTVDKPDRRGRPIAMTSKVYHSWREGKQRVVDVQYKRHESKKNR